MAEYLTTAQIASRLGIKPATWRAYVKRELAPAADRKLGPLPLWDVRTVEKWQRSRRGQGWKKSS